MIRITKYVFLHVHFKHLERDFNNNIARIYKYEKNQIGVLRGFCFQSTGLITLN